MVALIGCTRLCAFWEAVKFDRLYRKNIEKIAFKPILSLNVLGKIVRHFCNRWKKHERTTV